METDRDGGHARVDVPDELPGAVRAPTENGSRYPENGNGHAATSNGTITAPPPVSPAHTPAPTTVPPDWPMGTHRRRAREDWPTYLWDLLRTGPLLALVVAGLTATVFGLAGEVATLGGPTVWTSNTVMLVDQPYGIAVAGDQGLLLKLEGVRLKYQGLAATNLIAAPVATAVGLPVSAVEGATTINGPPDSLLMNVYGQWSTPLMAERLSSAVANQITAYVQQEDAQYKIPTNEQFTISVVNATSRAVASGPSHSKAATVGLGLAIAGFVIGFVLTQLIRNRRLGT